MKNLIFKTYNGLETTSGPGLKFRLKIDAGGPLSLCRIQSCSCEPGTPYKFHLSACPAWPWSGLSAGVVQTAGDNARIVFACVLYSKITFQIQFKSRQSKSWWGRWCIEDCCVDRSWSLYAWIKSSFERRHNQWGLSWTTNAFMNCCKTLSMMLQHVLGQNCRKRSSGWKFRESCLHFGSKSTQICVLTIFWGFIYFQGKSSEGSASDGQSRDLKVQQQNLKSSHKIHEIVKQSLARLAEMKLLSTFTTSSYQETGDTDTANRSKSKKLEMRPKMINANIIHSFNYGNSSLNKAPWVWCSNHNA